MRKKRIEIAVTEDEYAALLRRKTKARLASWIREVCLGEREANVRRADPELLYQLNRIGVNMNQIARKVNQSPIVPEDKAELLLALGRIEQSLQQVVDHAS